MYLHSVRGQAAQLNPAPHIKADPFGSVSKQSFSTEHFTKASEK